MRRKKKRIIDPDKPSIPQRSCVQRVVPSNRSIDFTTYRNQPSFVAGHVIETSGAAALPSDAKMMVSEEGAARGYRSHGALCETSPSLGKLEFADCLGVISGATWGKFVGGEKEGGG